MPPPAPAPLHFDEFAALTRSEWKQLILNTLKADTEASRLAWYTQKLIQNPEPGVQAEPFYTPEDMAGLEYLHGFHRLWAQTQQTTGWINTAHVAEPDAGQANRQARLALEGGADAVWFRLDGTATDLERLLESIPVSKTPVYFEGADPDLLSRLAAQPGSAHVMGGLAGRADAATADFCGLHPYFNVLFTLPDGPCAGQLAGGLAQAIRYVEAMQAAGLAATAVLPAVGFTTETGNHYFLEIAKLRALRLLWWQIGRLYDESLNLVDVFIHARTVTSEPPKEEPYKNLISNTTQAMSAILGGCDALTVLPAAGLSEGDETARRIARNVSAILKEECYLDRVTDPAAGSYLVENLTHQLAKAAWERLDSSFVH